MIRTAAKAGVGPDVFWRLSLREWRMLTEGPGGGVLMGRVDLLRMAERWPDDGEGGTRPSTVSRSPSPDGEEE